MTTEEKNKIGKELLPIIEEYLPSRQKELLLLDYIVAKLEAKDKQIAELEQWNFEAANKLVEVGKACGILDNQITDLKAEIEKLKAENIKLEIILSRVSHY